MPQTRVASRETIKLANVSQTQPVFLGKHCRRPGISLSQSHSGAHTAQCEAANIQQVAAPCIQALWDQKDCGICIHLKEY